MNLEMKLHTMRLDNGRLSLYAAVTVGKTTYFISRWDTARVTLKRRQHNLYRGESMTLYCGSFTV